MLSISTCQAGGSSTESLCSWEESLKDSGPCLGLLCIEGCGPEWVTLLKSETPSLQNADGYEAAPFQGLWGLEEAVGRKTLCKTVLSSISWLFHCYGSSCFSGTMDPQLWARQAVQRTDVVSSVPTPSLPDWGSFLDSTGRHQVAASKVCLKKWQMFYIPQDIFLESLHWVPEVPTFKPPLLIT